MAKKGSPTPPIAKTRPITMMALHQWVIGLDDPTLPPFWADPEDGHSFDRQRYEIALTCWISKHPPPPKKSAKEVGDDWLNGRGFAQEN